MRDGILDGIVSVLPTIGKVVCGLVSALDSDGGYMGFLGENDAKQGVDAAVFSMDNSTGRIYLNNTNTITDNVVAFSNADETYVVPSMTRWDVTDSLCNSSRLGSENLNLTASNKKNGITLMTSRESVKFVEDAVTHTKELGLGNFVKITWDALPDITISSMSSLYKITDIASVRIEGADYEYYAVYPKFVESANGMTIKLEDGISDTQYYNIRIEAIFAESGNGPAMLEGMEKLTEDDIKHLQKLKQNKMKTMKK